MKNEVKFTDESDGALMCIELPRVVSDETALQLFELMRRIANELEHKYEQQIERAEAERQRAIADFLREGETIKRERRFRAAQLGILDDCETDEIIPF